jgi:hypothetical protein
MPENTIPEEILTPLDISVDTNTSTNPNRKPMANCQPYIDAIKLRYGKDVQISGTYELNPDGTFKETTINIESPKGRHYSITEYFTNNNTDYVITSKTIDNRYMEHRFDRYIDAEIQIIDLIAGE